ncbi:MAG: FtsX-like permease family protein, partial [Gemmatimonadales bacterium]
ERVEALPGVTSAGLTSALPFSRFGRLTVYHVDEESGPGHVLHVEAISESYLESMGIPLRVGRHFESFDRPDLPLVALINQRMADTHWQNTNPVGQRFVLTRGVDRPGTEVTVVGVVGTVLKEGLAGEARAVAYFSLPQYQRQSSVSGRHVHLAVRSVGVPERVTAGVLREIELLDPQVVVGNVRSTADLVSASVAEPRFRAVLIGSFAALALLVSIVGIYGVMSFVIAQRTQEIGVRMALGATARGVLGQALAGGGRLIVVGMTIGTAAALAASRVLAGMLFDITATDPATFVGVTSLLAVAALTASYLPARRASLVDPMEALRVD